MSYKRFDMWKSQKTCNSKDKGRFKWIERAPHLHVLARSLSSSLAIVDGELTDSNFRYRRLADEWVNSLQPVAAFHTKTVS